MQKEGAPIGVFDSGYGGLTILRELRKALPDKDFIYLGDNARAPYGSRSFEVVYEFTLEAVRFLFDQGCELVVLACNTASAKALRSIQQKILPAEYPNKRVLGVIRPSTEGIFQLTKSKHIGILATLGTVKSNSYPLEIHKLYPEVVVNQLACPMWVPLVENGKYNTLAGKAFIQEDVETLLKMDPEMDAIILACTHYPILKPFIESLVPPHIQVVAQGPIVAASLQDYLKRHTWMNEKLSTGGSVVYLTTENEDDFSANASRILGESIAAKHIRLKHES